jgi:hypothetical protein
MKGLVFKEIDKAEMEGKLIVLNEELGMSCDFAISEIAEALGPPEVASFGRMAEHYRREMGFGRVLSLIECCRGGEVDALSSFISPGSPLLIVDYWGTKGHVPLGIGDVKRLWGGRSIVLVNRSVTQREYSEIYDADVLVEVKSLKKGRPLRFKGSLSVIARSSSLRAQFLVSSGSEGRYVRVAEGEGGE